MSIDIKNNRYPADFFTIAEQYPITEANPLFVDKKDQTPNIIS